MRKTRISLERDYIIFSTVIIAFLMIFCLFIGYGIYHSQRNSQIKNLDLRSQLVEAELTSSLDKVSHFMQFVGFKILKSNNKNLDSIKHLFQHDFGLDDKISDFYSLTILSLVKDGRIVVDPNKGVLKKTILANKNFPLRKAREQSWEMHIGNIIIKDTIAVVPVAMAIDNDDGEYYGTIISSIIIEVIDRNIKESIEEEYIEYLVLDKNNNWVLSSQKNIKNYFNSRDNKPHNEITIDQTVYKLYRTSDYGYQIYLGYNQNATWSQYISILIPYILIASAITFVFLFVMFFFRRRFILPIVDRLSSDLEKETEQRIENERMLSHILGNISGFAYRHKIYKNNIAAEYISDGCLELTGFGKEEYFGKSSIKHTDIIEKPHQEMVIQEISSCIEENRSFEIAYPITTKQGERKWVLNQGYPIGSNQGKQILFEGFLIDITELKNTELKMQKTLNELELSNKELEKFAYLCSHDLKEPLRTIFSYVQMVKGDNENIITQESFQSIRFIEHSCTRMKDLIENILLYSQVGIAKKDYEEIDVGKLVDEVITTLDSSIAGSKVTIVNKVESKIFANYNQIFQIFQNLLSNSIKFSKSENGNIRIGEELTKAGLVRFFVQDNGIGIKKEFYNKIFTLFERGCASNQYEGTGIGLALCQKIVSLYSGKIWFKSSQRSGTTFYFELRKKD